MADANIPFWHFAGTIPTERRKKWYFSSGNGSGTKSKLSPPFPHFSATLEHFLFFLTTFTTKPTTSQHPPFCTMEATQRNPKRICNLILPDSDEEQDPRIKRHKKIEQSAMLESDSTTTTKVLNQALLSIEVDEEEENEERLSKAHWIKSNSCLETNSQISSLQQRYVSPSPRPPSHGNLRLILEASALLSHRTLRHPLAPSQTQGLTANEGIPLPIGKPLLAPPRLPKLTLGQQIRRGKAGST